MNKIKVELIYPLEFVNDTKELELNELELNALMSSGKVGSEGKYFKIEEKIFEDSASGFSVTIVLSK